MARRLRGGSSGARSGARRSAGAAERSEHLGDGCRLGEHGSDGEASATAEADTKVDVEGSFEQGSPVGAGARCVELAIEQSVPGGHRQHVGRDELGGAGRRQRCGHDRGGGDHEGRTAVAFFQRGWSPRRRPGLDDATRRLRLLPREEGESPSRDRARDDTLETLARLAASRSGSFPAGLKSDFRTTIERHTAPAFPTPDRLRRTILSTGRRCPRRHR